MASTYSTSLRLELIGTGEQSGTWGTTTNTNLGTLLEQAIGGYQAIAMTDANYTLSTANGAADEARNAVLRFTGTLTAGRNVLCPDGIEKMYVVQNATTGGFAITFKTVSGTGISVANGSTLFLYVDGTNVLAVTGSLAAQNGSSVTITGGSITGITDLAVADGGTGASTAANARTNLGAAASGANTDLTSVYLNNTGLKIKDTNASHGLIIAPGSDLTADRTLTITTGDSARTVTISGNVTVSQDYSTTGNPQFATVELGAATDTTLGRAAAGVLAVEGNQVPSPASQAHGDILYRGASVWERLAAGTSGLFLQTAGAGAAPIWAAATTALTENEYTSGTGATWTKPSSANWVLIELWGGGGSGGKGTSSGPAGGGGGGAYSFALVKFSDLGGNVTYTVGAGGTGQTAATSEGNDGGTTSVSLASYAGGGTVTLSAFGGAGGEYSASGGGGGGGGGVLSAGRKQVGLTDQTGGNGGGPLGGTGGGSGVGGTDSTFGGGGGGGGASTSSGNGGSSYYGGGGGGGGEDSGGEENNGKGGDSYYGGGGGGGASNSSPAPLGGTSRFGGNGSNGAFDSNVSSAGSTPGGGSGGTEGGNSGNGGGGMVRFTYW